MISSRRRSVVTPPAVALFSILLAVACTACSTSQAQETSTSSSTATTVAPATTTTTPYVPTYVMVGRTRVQVPVEYHHVTIAANPIMGIGQNIIITSQGFEPVSLYGSSNYPIVFTNLTTKTQEVVFYHFPSYPKPIVVPPAGKVSITHNGLIALVYGNATGTVHGHIYLDTLPGVTSTAPYAGA